MTGFVVEFERPLCREIRSECEQPRSLVHKSRLLRELTARLHLLLLPAFRDRDREYSLRAIRGVDHTFDRGRDIETGGNSINPDERL